MIQINLEGKQYKKWLCIENGGEILVRALTLLGGTTKRNDDTKIGEFGSGNKYAIAYMLRNDIPFAIWSGTEHIRIDVNEQEFRGHMMSIITVNELETSLTTDAGPGWDAWQVFREIICNAVDEGKARVFYTDEQIGEEGTTRFYIDAKSDVADINFNEFFLWNRSEDIVWQSADRSNAIYNISDNRFARRASFYRFGIRVANDNQFSLGTPFRDMQYDFNCNDFEIDEVRNLKATASNTAILWRALITCNDLDVIDNAFEYLDFTDIHPFTRVRIKKQLHGVPTDMHLKPSDAWIYKLENSILYKAQWEHLILHDEKEATIEVSQDVLQAFQDWFGNSVKVPERTEGNNEYIEKPATKTQQQMIDKSIYRLSAIGIYVKYDVKVADMIERHTIGFACRDTRSIILADRAFESGIDNLTETIIEEYTHLHKNVGDYTREIQDEFLHIIMGLISRIELNDNNIGTDNENVE